VPARPVSVPVAVQTTPAALWSRVDVVALHRVLLSCIATEREAKRAYYAAARSQAASRVRRARTQLLAAHRATMRARAAESSARDALRRLAALA
jgi:hypothetical protein